VLVLSEVRRITAAAPARALVAGMLVGVLGALASLSPAVELVEQQYGLGWLFRLRGPRPPPDEVVIIAMDQRAGDNISLLRAPQEFERCNGLQFGPAPPTHQALPPPRSGRWPRCMHAILVDALKAAGARVIVFDVLFRPRTSGLASVDLYLEQDQRLAAAMRTSARVLLAQDYKPTEPSSGDPCTDEVPLPISPLLSAVALGVAPMPYAPTVFAGGADRADRFWTTKTCGIGTGTVTIPLVALQAYALDSYAELRALLQVHARDQGDLLPVSAREIYETGPLQAMALNLRLRFREDPELAGHVVSALDGPDAPALPASRKRVLRALVLAYSQEPAYFLNHYGPPGTLRRLSYDAALAAATGAPDALAASVGGRAVFIGYVEHGRPDRYEHWATPFPGDNGINTSGVELIGTAFANLLAQDAIRPISTAARATIALVMGLLVTAVCMYLPATLGIGASVGVVAAYCAAVLYLFASAQLWLPLVVPVGLAAPAGALVAAGWQYFDVVRDKSRLVRSLGLFVPPHVVEQLVRKPGAFESTRESLECSCLVTDAADYTTLSETLQSEQLAALLNQYFETLFRPVLDLGGYVSDVIGDSMLALWPERGGGGQERLRVCEACLDAAGAVERFNSISPIAKLPTRFGVHFGPVTLGLVGALTHYEYRAVGDTVNTANRVQGLNKRLGTRVLASDTAVEGLEQLLLRDLGDFRLKGKRAPLRIYEVLCRRTVATQGELRLCQEFADALAALRRDELELARMRFDRLVDDFPNDGPSAFYATLLRKGPLAGAVVDA
jgi:adenylate cyclase